MSYKPVFILNDVELASEVNRLSEEYIKAVMERQKNLSSIKHRLTQAKKEVQLRHSRKWKQ